MGDGASSASGLIMLVWRRREGDGVGAGASCAGTLGSGPNVDMGRGMDEEIRRFTAGCAGRPDRRFVERCEGMGGNSDEGGGTVESGRGPVDRGGGEERGETDGTGGTGGRVTVPERERVRPCVGGVAGGATDGGGPGGGGAGEARDSGGAETREGDGRQLPGASSGFLSTSLQSHRSSSSYIDRRRSSALLAVAAASSGWPS